MKALKCSGSESALEEYVLEIIRGHLSGSVVCVLGVLWIGCCAVCVCGRT